MFFVLLILNFFFLLIQPNMFFLKKTKTVFQNSIPKHNFFFLNTKKNTKNNIFFE